MDDFIFRRHEHVSKKSQSLVNSSKYQTLSILRLFEISQQ